ncbi:MAG: tRNA preQ1(34) S-adenosylmethionine ribosyltransferase-isomerase QueA [Candidatus Omnitrophica bacterium]|nr:tRNA preQ1(34) S-adenosylmethionine ribosyltransferase-isomerase QueA [Candidatus Omnitrophota bacterium]
MKLTDFDYSLPKELIAQYPAENRGDEKLLVVSRRDSSFEEKRFSHIADYLKKGDLLVLNDTKVILARIFGKRKTGGRVEIFVLDKTKNPCPALLRPSGKIKPGEKITLDTGDIVTALDRAEIGWFVNFEKSPDEVLRRCGHVPLPPYIKRPDESRDEKRYQTVYAEHEGATASPTAGLHFTQNLLDILREKGVIIARVTLHTSYGTFAPIKEENVEKHKMHSESYRISDENACIIREALERKARIFACGTTALRTLEACAENLMKTPGTGQIPVPGTEGVTNLFIYPGYKFKIVDALITNFHLPKSTLILLASAFAGKELLFKAYEYAIKNEFRFFSYGDATLIV